MCFSRRLLSAPRQAVAYSVLAHEANIDALWDSTIQPLLAKRFPQATREQLKQARAFAYGGSVIQDLGYYPFGNHFFSNLLHYVRGGDFVETMLHEARDVNEYAFALGALAHYAADNTGHPEAVNRAVALMFPSCAPSTATSSPTNSRPRATSSSSSRSTSCRPRPVPTPPRHITDFIGFEVAKPLLERTFLAVYGLEMKDVFVNEDLAIGSYRHAISDTIPTITRIAWRDKREAIQRLKPDTAEAALRLQPLAPRLRAGFRARLPAAGPADDGAQRVVSPAAENRPAASVEVQSADARGRGDCFSRASRTRASGIRRRCAP